MTSNLPPSGASPVLPPLRIWPGVVLVAVQWLARFVLPVAVPEAMPIGVMAGPALGILTIGWWLFFSRARWGERLGILAVIAVAIAGTTRLIHPSLATGMMGFMYYVYVMPVVCLALVGALVVGRSLPDGARRALVAGAIVVGCLGWTLVRTGGFSSDLKHDWAWRWAPTPEDRLLAQAREKTPAARAAPAPTVAVKSGANWPGFRGPGRDGVVRGVKIATDWAASPPVEMWRRPIGPGWSSFAVNDGVFFTQEQRGEEESVSCHRLADGELVWRHTDPARFWESNAGPGPRGTPTLHAGRVYTFGATGIVNALDAATGAVVWSRNAATDTKRKIPDWGLSSSPLVVGDNVVIAVSGTLAAYDLATGAPRWTGPADGGSYSSPHLVEIGGVRQIFLMGGAGAVSVAPTDGKVLWQHAWKGFAVVQPVEIAPGDFLISTGDTAGVRRIQVTLANDTWTVTERWASNRLKPYFNDTVRQRGHAYGFGSGTLACIDLEDGKSKWKGGRYGSGQVLLLADQDVLLVLSEQGELALVSAQPEAFTELARFKALEGKTWNHPVLVGDVLLVRNDREMAAFQLR